MRPDGTDARGVVLPNACSPRQFTAETLVCWNTGDHAYADRNWSYAVKPEAGGWRSVAMPVVGLPDWAGPDQDQVDAAQWSPSRDRIAFVRRDDHLEDSYGWFSAFGEISIAAADGSGEHVLADVGEGPQWSHDGKRVAFARCRTPVNTDWIDTRAKLRCSLWAVDVERGEPRRLVDDAESLPVWSPDDRYVAFLRRQGSCESFCRYRIVVVPSIGGAERTVGPQLAEPGDETWGGLAWITGPVPTGDPSMEADSLELQRCVDVWNRARMDPFATGLLNVNIVAGNCQVTLSDYGGVCSQVEEMPFRFSCPDHGAPLQMLPAEYRVWNGYARQGGTVTLFDPPQARRLPLPPAPHYPLLDGFVLPFDKNWEPLPTLRLKEVDAACPWSKEWSKDLAYDIYALECGWDGWGRDHCFKRPGELKVGDFVLCSEYVYNGRYDPLSFTRVKVTRTY
jgi:hypothetical protein